MSPLTIRHLPSTLKIGTRKSPLAMAQAGQVRDVLMVAWPQLEGRIELVAFITSGDRFLNQSLSDIGGKGLFTKEIEEALLAGHIDLAIHSLKDMPTELPDGLMLGAIPEREDPRDVLISRSGATCLEELPPACRLGTSSPRRAAQVIHARPDITILPLRGNVQTRLAKLEAGEVDATLLALAGLKRLGLNPIPGYILSIEECLPAVAQGALALECREDNAHIRKLLAPLNHVESQTAITAERAFLRTLDGSCRTPIAAYAEVRKNALWLRGLIANADGSRMAEEDIRGNTADAEMLGKQLGEKLQNMMR